VTLSLHQRLRMFTSIQQSGLVLALVGLNLVLCHWLQIMTAQSINGNIMFLMAALTSAAIWPSLFHLLRQIRRSFAVR
jgi:rod shape-determining protein MreD